MTITIYHNTWTAIVGPRGMPREAVERLNAGITTTFRTPEVADRMKQIGFVPWFMTPEELAPHMDAEITRWIHLSQDMNLQPQ